MPTYKLVIQYDGTAYAGWQVQRGLPTVQGELLGRLRMLCDDPGIKLAGAARTDSGTHALGQVGSFSTAREWEPSRLRRALNRLLPDDIAAEEIEQVDDGFHARRSATGRVYRYQIVSREVIPPFLARYAYHFRSALDLGPCERRPSPLSASMISPRSGRRRTCPPRPSRPFAAATSSVKSR